MYGYQIFHNDIMISLIDSVRRGTNSHAYIFSGSEGLGKHQAARLFAAALTCRVQQSAPCGSCPACIQAKANSNPDIVTIDSGSKKTIGVEPIRALNEDAFIKPFGTANKVYIIEGDLLTEQAQNALLKTLEEPPEYAVFIILSTNYNNLLQTILSRCTLIQFPPVSAEVIGRYLQENFQNADPGTLEFAQKAAEGNPGTARELLTDTDYQALRESALKNLEYLFSSYPPSTYRIVAYFDANKDKIQEILDLWILYIRDIFVLSQSPGIAVINSDYKDTLTVLSAKLDAKLLISAIPALIRAKEMDARSVNTKAAIEHLCLKIKRQKKTLEQMN